MAGCVVLTVSESDGFASIFNGGHAMKICSAGREMISALSRQENRRDEDFLAVKIEASVPRVRDPAHAYDTSRADPRSIELFDVDPWSEMCFGRFGGHIQ